MSQQLKNLIVMVETTDGDIFQVALSNDENKAVAAILFTLHDGVPRVLDANFKGILTVNKNPHNEPTTM